MRQTNFQSVDEYIAVQPLPVQEVLRIVRSTIRKAVPTVEELISYKIPAYKLKDQPVLYFAAWKHHFSIYPATASLVGAFGSEVTRYFDSKSTLRFPFSEPVPTTLIERIAKFRATEVYDKAKASTSKTRKRYSDKAVSQQPQRGTASARM